MRGKVLQSAILSYSRAGRYPARGSPGLRAALSACAQRFRIAGSV